MELKVKGKFVTKGHLFLFNHFIDMRTTVSLSISCRKNVFLLKFSNKNTFFLHEMDKLTVVLMSIKWLNKIEQPLVLATLRYSFLTTIGNSNHSDWTRKYPRELLKASHGLSKKAARDLFSSRPTVCRDWIQKRLSKSCRAEKKFWPQCIFKPSYFSHWNDFFP